MTAQIIRIPEVMRPTVEPLGSSVLDHAIEAGNVVDLASFGLRNNEGLWPSYNCIDTLVPTPLCPNPLLTETGGYKTFDKAEWQPSFEFAVQGGVQCHPMGQDEADRDRELLRVFESNEGKGIEQALLLNRFVATDSDAPVQWDAPIDLTPADQISPAMALALLEGYAAAVYSGKPTIHMPRAVVSLLNERIVWKGDLAFTRSGAKIAAGGGYDSSEVSDGTFDMYVTGEVYIERSKTVKQSAMVLPGDGSGTGSDQNGLPENQSIALVERAFRVAVDCMVAKVTATLVPLTGGGFGL